jgi:hypothetical protein
MIGSAGQDHKSSAPAGVRDYSKITRARDGEAQSTPAANAFDLAVEIFS